MSAAHSPPSAALRAQWQRDRSLRVPELLPPDQARAVLDELRVLPHQLTVPSTTGPSPSTLKYLMATHENYPDADCEHPVCALVRWWFSDGMAWVSALTGLDLAPPPSGMVLSTLYSKGSYLEAHNDKAEGRRVAFILGFTDQSWPWQQGGHLEFLSHDDHGVRVAERRAPGFNTLDLFDVTVPDRTHQIPILTEHHERRVLSGWFHAR